VFIRARVRLCMCVRVYEQHEIVFSESWASSHSRDELGLSRSSRTEPREKISPEVLDTLLR